MQIKLDSEQFAYSRDGCLKFTKILRLLADTYQQRFEEFVEQENEVRAVEGRELVARPLGEPVLIAGTRPSTSEGPDF